MSLQGNEDDASTPLPSAVSSSQVDLGGPRRHPVSATATSIVSVDLVTAILVDPVDERQKAQADGRAPNQGG